MREAAHDIGLFYGKGKRATLSAPHEGPTRGRGGLKAGFPHQLPCLARVSKTLFPYQVPFASCWGGVKV